MKITQKMKSERCLFCLLLLATVCLPLITIQAQESSEGEEKWHDKLGRWVEGTPWTFDKGLPTTHTKYLLQIGDIGIQDEYLSPIAHNGHVVKVTFLTDFRQKNLERRWHLYQDLSMTGGLLENKANGSAMYHLAIDYALGPSWRVINHKGLSLDLAPLVALKVGGNYKPNNTNNIGNVKGHLGVEAWSRVRYQLPWHSMPIGLSYTLQAPLIQMAFHPEYGQSYYDFVSGDNGASIGLHLAALHNTQVIKQRLLIDLPIHNVTLTLGAEHTHFSQKLNYTAYREGSWGVVLGFSLDLFSLSGGKAVASQQLNSTYYQ